MYDLFAALDLAEKGGNGGDPAVQVSAAIRRPGTASVRATGRSDVEALLTSLPDMAPILVRDAAAAAAFFEADASSRRPWALLDLGLLSRMFFPQAPSHEIDDLREHLELTPPAGGCDLLFDLWQRIRLAIDGLPAATLTEINRLLADVPGDPFHDLFVRAAAARPQAADAAADSRPESLLANQEPLCPRRERPPAPPERTPLDPEAVAAMFGPEGHFAGRLNGYECRQGQMDMAKRVVQVLNASSHAMIEAGTGTGKSLAYLLPAALWAIRNGTPVVVSTNTKNLQTQLFEKDLPLIRRVLQTDFRAALIKGRLNYLCVRRLFFLLLHADTELTASEKILMVGVLAWAAMTRTGDLAENAAWGQATLRNLGVKLTSTGEECLGRACRHGGLCFLRRARSKSLAADVVVANHSLVLAELNTRSPALPPYDDIVFDEAHNLEEAATRHFTVEISMGRLRTILQRLWRRAGKGRHTGLLAAVLRQVDSGTFAQARNLQEGATKAAADIQAALATVEPAMDPFFSSLAAALNATPGREDIPIPGRAGDSPAGLSIHNARLTLADALARVAGRLDALAETLRDAQEGSLPFHMEALQDLTAMATGIREFIGDADFVLKAEEAAYVYWIERAHPRDGGARAMAAPIDVGQRLHADLYDRKASVILCSATLSVRGSFNFLGKRLGMDRVDAARLVQFDAGTSFDHARQCVVMVPTFLPEPGEQDERYADELGRLLADVFRRTKGRGLALFTSYQMLRQTTEVLQRHAAADPYQILAQGVSGSRDSITTVFRKDIESVLMGTHSFWEGVDIAGESLSCLVVARLPFAVFTDPVVAARCRQVESEGQDAFMAYLLPNAVIRLRQGFGRLIRRRTDRGVVIVADRRMVTKRYGSWFVRSLPTRTVAFDDRAEFLDAVETFLAEGATL